MKLQSIERYFGILKNTISRGIFGVNRDLKIKHITFELTNLCNSKCDMCHIWANEENPNTLTTNEIKRIFSDPALMDLEDVLLTGGEMYLRDDIDEIIRIIHRVNPKTRIFASTNGLLAEKILKMAEISAKEGIEVNYGLSLDGVGERHDKRRRMPGNFELIDEKLIPGLKDLDKKYPGKIKLVIGMCMDDYGMESFDKLESYAKQRDIPFLAQMVEDFDYYLPEVKRERKVEGSDWEKIHFTKLGIEGENRILKKEIYNVDHKKYAKYVKRLIPTVHHFRLLSMLEGRNIKYECSSMRNFFLLRYDGKISPCLRFADWEVGDLKKNSLSDISRTKTYKNSVDAILKCEGCLNTWCTDWSMELNAAPFYRETYKWVLSRFFGFKA